MSYHDIAQMALDTDLLMRVQACAAQELPPTEDPYTWVTAHMLRVAGQPGWAEAWAAAVAAGNKNPGRDPAVITDSMIPSGIQVVESTL